MIDELGDDPRILRVLLDLRGVLLVDFLLRRLRAGLRGRAQPGHGNRQQANGQREAPQRASQRDTAHTVLLKIRAGTSRYNTWRLDRESAGVSWQSLCFGSPHAGPIPRAAELG